MRFTQFQDFDPYKRVKLVKCIIWLNLNFIM